MVILFEFLFFFLDCCWKTEMNERVIFKGTDLLIAPLGRKPRWLANCVLFSTQSNLCTRSRLDNPIDNDIRRQPVDIQTAAADSSHGKYTLSLSLHHHIATIHPVDIQWPETPRMASTCFLSLSPSPHRHHPFFTKNPKRPPVHPSSSQVSCVHGCYPLLSYLTTQVWTQRNLSVC